MSPQNLKDLEQAPGNNVWPLKQAPGNVAVTPDGNVFISHHPLYFDKETQSPEVPRVERLQKGEWKPFPNDEWAKAPKANGNGMHKALGIRADQRGVVWMLDNAVDVTGAVPKVVAWDTRNDKLHKKIRLPHAMKENESLNLYQDLAVDLVNEALYLADFRSPSILVVSLKTDEWHGC